VSPIRQLTARDIERITRDVLDGMGLPLPRTLAVVATEDGWQLVIQTATGFPQLVDLPSGRAIALREALIAWAEGMS
jgi:hypothetical protein